jgi:uracil-DNA glycosylase family 4
VLLVALAPAAHGANRTGRVFTGDGSGGSSEFLMRALHRTGFANMPTSQHIGDGLRLDDCYISSAVRCAPPDNKPLPEERARCLDHLEAEVAQLPEVRVVIALGKIAFDAWLQLQKRRGVALSPRPAFGHGVVADLGGGESLLMGCYHPSRQNTNTGKLTAPMIERVLLRARELADRRT